MPPGALTAEAAAPGFYGKLPARGDFVSRRLGHGFISAWDRWLQEALPASREALGGDWLDRYLTSPIWRFAFAAESCGPVPVAGVLMPSVDAVGRYFPLMIGRELPAGIDLCAFAAGAGAWYEALEALALAALDDGFALESFEAPLPTVTLPPAGVPTDATPLDPPGRRLILAEASPPEGLCRGEGGGAPRRTLWWSNGSPRIQPSLLICPGLPPPAGFAALLDGEWGAYRWIETAPASPAGNAALAWDREE